MIRHRAAWLALSLLVAGVTPSAANDSSSELGAGGLVLTKTDAISMQREDLTISPAEVRVRYEMRNDTAQPVTLRVAFPMPDVPSMTPAGMTNAAGTLTNIELRPPTQANFMAFRVWADGREINPESEIRAVLPDGRDIAAALREIGGLPLVLQPGLFLPDERTLTTGQRQRLKALGALEDLDNGLFRLPWQTTVTFHWMQTFPPGVTVVEHSYRPVIGFHFVVVDGTRPLVVSGIDHPVRDFCIEPPAAESIRAADRQMKAARHGKDEALWGFTLGYILQTARNWRGPIGTFHLTLQGGPITFDGVSRGEVRVTSLCTDLPLARTGPQRFEATTRDYVPRQDLRILYIAY